MPFGKLVALSVTVEELPAHTSVTLVVRPERFGLAVIVIASVFPVAAAVLHPLKVNELIVTFVVPDVLNEGVMNVPLLLALTVIDMSVATCELAPVKV